MKPSIETDDYLITSDFIPARQIAESIRHFRPELIPNPDYAAFTLPSKKTGYQKTTLVELDGGKEPYFYTFNGEDYCNVEVLFVTVRRSPPR